MKVEVAVLGSRHYGLCGRKATFEDLCLCVGYWVVTDRKPHGVTCV